MILLPLLQKALVWRTFCPTPAACIHRRTCEGENFEHQKMDDGREAGEENLEESETQPEDGPSSLQPDVPNELFCLDRSRQWLSLHVLQRRDVISSAPPVMKSAWAASGAPETASSTSAGFRQRRPESEARSCKKPDQRRLPRKRPESRSNHPSPHGSEIQSAAINCSLKKWVYYSWERGGKNIFPPFSFPVFYYD